MAVPTYIRGNIPRDLGYCYLNVFSSTSLTQDQVVAFQHKHGQYPSLSTIVDYMLLHGCDFSVKVPTIKFVCKALDRVLLHANHDAKSKSMLYYLLFDFGVVEDLDVYDCYRKPKNFLDSDCVVGGFADGIVDTAQLISSLGIDVRDTLQKTVSTKLITDPQFAEGLINSAADRILRDRGRLKSNEKNPVYINCAMTADQEAMLFHNYPSLKICFADLREPHGHGYFAASRKCDRRMLLIKARYDRTLDLGPGTEDGSDDDTGSDSGFDTGFDTVCETDFDPEHRECASR